MGCNMMKLSDGGLSVFDQKDSTFVQDAALCDENKAQKQPPIGERVSERTSENLSEKPLQTSWNL